jgi:hypothetical protein
MSKNTLLLIENIVVWGGVIFAFMVKMLPLIQAFARTATYNLIRSLNNNAF